jgi:phenylpropionate dioxygenase-like ring-hydroxylating dioxygenase large terminal subunit
VGHITRYGTIEQDGLVYVFMGEDSRNARRSPFCVPYYHDPDWCTYFMVTSFQNGVTNLVENFMDVPHTVFVHKGWFRTRRQKRVSAVVQRENGSVRITYEQSEDRLTGLGRILNPFGDAMIHTDQYFIPNITRVDYSFGTRGGLVINSQVTPVGPTDSIVYTAISYRFPIELPKNLLARAMKPLVSWYTRQVILQDVDIMQNQRIGITGGPGGGRFMSTEADLPHADIEAYRTWLREDGEGDGPADEERRIAFWI